MKNICRIDRRSVAQDFVPFSLRVAVTIVSINCALHTHGGMARLSWPGRWLYSEIIQIRFCETSYLVTQ